MGCTKPAKVLERLQSADRLEALGAEHALVARTPAKLSAAQVVRGGPSNALNFRQREAVVGVDPVGLIACASLLAPANRGQAFARLETRG